MKMMFHDPIGDYSLSPRRSPDSSCLLPPGLRIPDRAEPKKRYRGAEGDLRECGGWYELDCEDAARDRRGVNPDGHPGSPLHAPLQNRLRRPEARDQEVRQMFPLQYESGNYNYTYIGAVPVSAKMSPLQQWQMEDKFKGIYMDVEKPSSMQTWWRSVALCYAAACAAPRLRTKPNPCAGLHSLTSAGPV